MMPRPTPTLQVVERWAREMGNEVAPASATNQAGQTLPALSVKHGAVTLLIVDQNGVLGVMSLTQIPPELRQATESLSNEIQERILNALRSGLMDNPRTGWTLVPSTVTRISELEAIQLIQLLRVAEQGIEGFNRLADAIQEIVTMTIKLGTIYGGALKPGAALPPSTAKKTSDHNPIYR